MAKKYYTVKLEKNGGCEGCTRNCPYNAPTARPEVAKRTKGRKYRCNNSRKDFGK